MNSDYPIIDFGNAPLEIIDGDRGVNYPKNIDFSAEGFCLFLNAGNVTTSGFRFEECSFISEERDKLLRKGRLERYDVVLTTRGTVGNAAFYSNDVPYEKIRINSGMVILRPDRRRLSPEYLYAFLTSSCFKEQVRVLVSGSAQPQLPIRDIRNIKIPLPTISEQEQIVNVVSPLESKITLNHRLNSTLETIEHTLFKSWFIDFDAVRTKAAGRAPEGMDADTAALFPSEFEESAVGWIPRGWKPSNFGSLIQEQNLRRGARESLPVLSAIQTGALVKSEDVFLKQVFSKDTSKYKVVDPLWFAYNPSRINIGSIGLNDYSTAGIVSPVYVVFSLTRPDYAWWLRFHIRSSSVRNSINILSSGTVRQNLSFGDFASIPVVIPKLEVVKAFNDRLFELEALIRTKNGENRALVAIRDALLPRLISGQTFLPSE